MEGRESGQSWRVLVSGLGGREAWREGGRGGRREGGKVGSQHTAIGYRYLYLCTYISIYLYISI